MLQTKIAAWRMKKPQNFKNESIFANYEKDHYLSNAPKTLGQRQVQRH